MPDLALDFGTVEKQLGATIKYSCTFAPDLAEAGSGVTISGNATVTGSSDITATHVSTTAAGVVTVQVSSGKAHRVGIVTITAVYSNGETQVGELKVSPI